jgi:hypothetical protein
VWTSSAIDPCEDQPNRVEISEAIRVISKRCCRIGLIWLELMGLSAERRVLARAVPPEIGNLPVFLRGEVLSFGAEDIFFVFCARRDGIVLALGLPVIV